jgi:chorismate mutase-like protein
MAAISLDLQDLRRRLDRIDDGLHDLLVERAEIVALVADAKRADAAAFYQPGREAEIIRRLAARHRGALPVASLVRIWRELLAATVGLETRFAAAVFAPPEAPGFWDLARDHYGSYTPITVYRSTGQVIRAVSEGRASVGVLPMPQEGEADAWWRHLISHDDAAPRVIARLPFGPRGNARTDGADALVIGRGAPQETGTDRSLIAAETASDISRSRILRLLSALGLVCTFFASVDQPERSVSLIEIDGFVSITDPRLERLRAELGPALFRLLPLGGYAVPLFSTVAAPAAATAG